MSTIPNSATPSVGSLLVSVLTQTGKAPCTPEVGYARLTPQT